VEVGDLVIYTHVGHLALILALVLALILVRLLALLALLLAILYNKFVPKQFEIKYKLGASCSGKSTLTEIISNLSGIPILHQDRFFKKDSEIPTENGVQHWDCPQVSGTLPPLFLIYAWSL
jgi:hypothetical protein